MKNLFTPANITITLLVANMFLKGFRDAWEADKDLKGADRIVSIIVDTLLYVTGKRAS